MSWTWRRICGRSSVARRGQRRPALPCVDGRDLGRGRVFGLRVRARLCAVSPRAARPGPGHHPPARKRLRSSWNAKTQLDQASREKPQERLHRQPALAHIEHDAGLPPLGAGAGRQNLGDQQLKFADTPAAEAASLRAHLQIGFASHGQRISLMETGATRVLRTQLFRRYVLPKTGRRQGSSDWRPRR